MSVEELEEAVQKLPPQELVEFARWFEEFQERTWDEQIARDARAGRFDEMIAQAKSDATAGRCRDL